MQTARSFHVKSRWKSGWQNADEKCTRRKCGRTRVVRLLASWIRGIIPSTQCTPCAFLRSAHFFHVKQNPPCFPTKTTYYLVTSRSINTFFFFFNKSANFFQLFLSIFRILSFYLFKENLYTIICYDTKLIRQFFFFFFEQQRVIFLWIFDISFFNLLF